MSVTIDLPSDIEAALVAQARARARARGLDLARHIEQVLCAQMPHRAGSDLSPAERAEAWREAARGLPHTAPLSDEVISREHSAGRELS